ncbi:MAG: M28 family peptidase [Planctomycetota bacterium]
MELLPSTRFGRVRLAALTVVPATSVAVIGWAATAMPGTSFRGTPPDLTEEEAATRDRLVETIKALTEDIGERHHGEPESLGEAERYLTKRLEALELEVTRQPYLIDEVEVANLEVRIEGTEDDLACLVVGAHYDTIDGTPGADDNASGAAALVEVARLVKDHAFRHDLLLVLYTNEEPPSFQTESMGSVVHSTSMDERGDEVAAMLSIESVGFFTDEEGSQEVPRWLEPLYPDTGNFIAFVGDLRSRKLVKRCIASFREHAEVPSEALAAPAGVPGVGWSDHWSYWQRGYEALMVTDTALFRNPHYHEDSDTLETLDLDVTARIVHGLARVVVDLDAKKAD